MAISYKPLFGTNTYVKHLSTQPKNQWCQGQFHSMPKYALIFITSNNFINGQIIKSFISVYQSVSLYLSCNIPWIEIQSLNLNWYLVCHSVFRQISMVHFNYIKNIQLDMSSYRPPLAVKLRACNFQHASSPLSCDRNLHCRERRPDVVLATLWKLYTLTYTSVWDLVAHGGTFDFFVILRRNVKQ